MGQYIVKLPDIGEGTTEAEIVKWHVKPGQEIREEDPLVDIMPDKATVEIPAPIAGTVVAIEGNVGEKRPVGSLLVTLDVAGAGNVAAGAQPAAAPARSAGAQRAPAQKKPARPHPSAATAAGSPAPAVRERETTPLARTRPSTAKKANGEATLISFSRTAGEGAEESEADESILGAAPRRNREKPLASPAVRRRAWGL